jgi:hypothetical protein
MRVFATLLAVASLCGLVTTRADVVITELMYHPASDLETEEFIELYNTGALDADLQDWCFDGVDFCFPPGTILTAGQFLVLASDAAQFETTYGFAPDHAYLARLDNSGERIALLDAASQIVDEVVYGDLPPWPVTADGLGPSLEVVDPDEDNATPRNWRASTDPGGQTAGQLNSVDSIGLPPWIEGVSHTIDPAPSVPVVVTAFVHDATSAELFYRIDFDTETLVSMLDDGDSGDGAAGDGVYGAMIPGQPAGTLVRYRISASGGGGLMLHPRDDDTVTYDGTAVSDPTLDSNLPVFWWFMDPDDYQAAIDHRFTDELEPAVFYHDGTLIDAIQVRVRGQSARNYVKKHWKFRMPHGHDFYDAALVPIPLDQFNLQGNYSDKTYAREILSYESFLESGSTSNLTFGVRLQQNGAFYGLYTFVQAMDDDYLTTNGLDTDGAWYKAFDDCRFRSLSQLPGRYEKKTRLHEGHEDLFALLDGVNNLSGTARRDFIFDNVDLAAMANYLATTVVIHNTDFPHKNYFIYRDTEGNQRWRMQPWDMDLTFGRNWQGTVLNDEIWADRDSIPDRPAAVSPSHPLVGEEEHKNWDTRWNRLIDALYEEPEFRTMYFRRLRTLTDSLLAVGKYEARIDAVTAPKTAEAELDRNLWGQYGVAQSMAEAVAILKAQYLEVRRTHLLTTHRIAGEVPEAQSVNPQIAITEIMYAPAGGPDHEFVELYNPSPTEAVDLSGYRLDGVGLSFPAGTVILPDDYLVVVRNDPAFRAEYGSGRFVPAQYQGALDNGGESLSLRSPNGSVVARVDYSAAEPWPAAAAGAGSSLELIDPTTDNGWVANWVASAAPGGTPGAPNSGAGTAPPRPGIYINEVLPLNESVNSDEEGDFDAWIEIFNATTTPVDLAAMTLTTAHSVPGMWELPAGTVLCGGCYLLIWADDEATEGPLHASFPLNPFGGTVGLYDAAGGIVDYLDYPFVTADTSFGRFPDGKADLRVFATATPEAANEATLIPLILNEYNAVDEDKVLENDGTDSYWGTVTGNGGDWLELVVTENHLDARGWQLVLTDQTGGPGETQTTLVLSNDPLWSDLRSGTLVTISEDLPDDPSFDPATGDWWINVQASDGSTGTYITAQDFTVSNNDSQLTILDELGATIFGPVGEGIAPQSGVGGDEVFKLEEDPSPFVTPFSAYNDGSSSSFGGPNRFASGTLVQDFDSLRCGGQACAELNGPCSLGVCDTVSGQCELVPINEGGTCDDGNACTTGDTCVNASCSGIEPDCSHLDDACNVGSCNPLTVLCEAVPTHQGMACDDTNPCTVIDSCDVGVCTGSPKDCSSADEACAVGVCNPTDGLCEPQFVGDGTSCDDQDACTTGESCTGGNCAAADPIVCDDGNVCTVDACNPESGCVFTPDDDQDHDLQPDPCDDSVACTTLDVCAAGVCGGVPLCEDGNVCTIDSCDAGTCSFAASGACGVTGTVRYYRDGSGQTEPGLAAVSGVEIDLDGDLLTDRVTESDGTYAAPDLSGSLAVRALPRLGAGGAADANGAISPFDATFIGQHAVQIIELSPNQQVAADVSGNGSISAFDAALVAQLSVLLLEHLPVADQTGSDWLFLRCDNYFSAADNDCTTALYLHDPLEGPAQDDFHALLYGDVTGNWQPASPADRAPDLEAQAQLRDRQRTQQLAATTPGRLLNPQAPGAFALSEGVSLTARDDAAIAEDNAGTRRIVISVERDEPVQSVDVALHYDPDRVEVLGIETLDSTRDFNIITHDAKGTFKSALWSLVPANRSGDLLAVTLRYRGQATRRSIDLDVQINEQPVPVEFRTPQRRLSPASDRSPEGSR